MLVGKYNEVQGTYLEEQQTRDNDWDVEENAMDSTGGS